MAAAVKPASELNAWERFKKDVVRDKWLYLLLLPGMAFMLIFRYIPIFGNVIAFMEYNPYDMAGSTWVGFDQFIKLFQKPAFMKVFGNTLYISILKMVCGFPIPIILALMMNEMRNMKFKKASQTLLYLPHFISWVVMAGLIMSMLDPTTGLVTAILKFFTGKDLQVLTDKNLFVPMLIITDIYKGMGWGTIIYFAALSGVDPQLYEAAEIDGARKWKQLLHITLPSITPTIVIMLILNCNNIVNAGFDQIFMLYSALVYDVADIIDTYVYRIGIQKADYSFSTAAGMFKSVIALVMILIVNTVAKKTGNEGIW
ncbi:ABC transporter permease [Anaeromassilibacillus senegalensis]|uniref:Sugar ABC transporter permease n=1 Tax=Anaeromassilibacillus senegalensis TaxID=1673717 RepID=A0ABS9CPX1_9FIRM|nr:ABC transporter permease subunit [Anaeromassilibacillus senegalensis]MCF2652380.1 sugar ABC transporter permease [Anaeromassilibacillus senegalensis]